MDDMLDLTTGDALIRRRLDAYAELRLSPDLATSSRIRARVLAVAHRQADIARADAALTVVTAATPAARRASRRSPRLRRLIVGLLAASLALGAAAGTAFAARPGGSLYEPRLWLETVFLPSDPSQRALAELDRLELRLVEAAEALRSGDSVAAAAALEAYARIIDQATTAALAAHDDVAVAALEAGVGHNMAVLQALILALPDQAADRATEAIQRAVERAIDRSDRTIERIERGQQPSSTPTPNAGGAKPTPAPTAKPTPRPTSKPAGGPSGGGAGGGQPTSTDEPGKPDRSPKPSPQHDPG